MDEVNVEQVLRILHLEDDPADSEMARQLLRKGGLEARIDRVYTMDALRQQLESESYALILSDYTIPGVDALDALRLARQACPQTPYIFLSGTLGEDVAIETLKMGATDYVLKQRLERLVPAVRRALQESEAQNRRRQAETALRQSEELYRTTFENAAVGIAHVAPDGNWLSVNDRLCQITGYTRAELLDSITFQSITYPEDLPADLQQLEQLLEGRIQTYRLEKRCIHKDGHLVWVNLTVSLRRDETGRPLDCIAVVEDITPRKQAEQALRESEQRVRASEERLRRAISIETVGVLFFNLDGRIIDANKAFEGMSGYSVEELRSAVHWENLTPPEFRDVTCQTAESLMTRGETAPYEKQIIRKDGSRWWGLFAPTRLSGSGRDSQCVEFIIDISERKRIEEALKELNEHLEQRVVERTAALERERRRLFDMLETLPVMIALFRPDHHVVFANRKFRDAFGEAHGRPCHEYIFGKELPCEFCQAFIASHKSNVSKCVNTSNPVEVEARRHGRSSPTIFDPHEWPPVP